MKENKTNILIFFGISIFCIFLTYVLSAFNLGKDYLPKDFLLAIFSEISASSFVVLFIELMKYNSNKKNIENALDNNCKHRFLWEKDKAIVDDYSFPKNGVSIQRFFENNTYSEESK